MTKDLKRKGYGAVDHYPAITEEDLTKMYEYLTSSQDVQLLQCKVFVNIMLHFGRRGRENLAGLTSNDFAVTTDPAGHLYVYKMRDESTKNHQDDSNKSSDGRMYEIKDSSRCPVRSFVKYLNMLNPDCNKFFSESSRRTTKRAVFLQISGGPQHFRLLCV